MRFISIFIFICFFSCAEKNEEIRVPANTPIKLLTKSAQYTAGSEICITFSASKELLPYLVLKNALGTSVLKPVKDTNQLRFCVPPMYANKAGIMHWSLVLNSEEIEAGQISIAPDATTTFLETYFGPRQITAGKNDFSMLVNIPTDNYDNTLVNGTMVTVNREFEDEFHQFMVPISKSIAWKNINATEKSGRILVSALCRNTNSKQLTTIVYPAMPTDFEIGYQRDHTFADGNQIITLQTNKILDIYGNVVSDGTHVNFLIENQDGIFMSATGNTINGRAIARLLHPEEPTTWKAKAFITGAARSNTIVVGFKASVEDYPINFDKDQRKLSIGPLLGFMQQKVTDGFSIQLSIKSEANIINEEEKLFTKDGKASYILDKNFYPSGTYNITIEAAGISKELLITLPNE